LVFHRHGGAPIQDLLAAITQPRAEPEPVGHNVLPSRISQADFAHFKRQVLIIGEEDISGVYQAWWLANTLFPETAISTRISLAECALHELLTEHLIRLVRDDELPEQSEVPQSEQQTVLREWAVWTWDDPGCRAFFETTPAGTEALGYPAESDSDL
jgi:hypothetical protein